MLNEKQLDRYADVMIWALKTSRSHAFRKNDIVLIRFHAPALRLAEIVYDRAVETGWNPIARLMPTMHMETGFYEKANDSQLEFIDPGMESLYSRLNGSIFLYAPESITHLSHIDPVRFGKPQLAVKPLRDILDRRDEGGDFGWTFCLYPTPALAEQSGMTPKEYARQVTGACFLNRAAPVEQWMSVYSQIRRVRKQLDRLDIRTLHIESRKTDLTVEVGQHRRWLGLSGHNIPSFEVFISPDARGTQGVYHADQVSFRNGHRVKGITLEFVEGRVVSAKADEGESFLRQQLELDEGAGRIGEFSLTDRRFSRISRFMAHTLYDENFGGRQGNCHIALGAAYSSAFNGDPNKVDRNEWEQMGFNDSALHWDIVNTEKKRVTAFLKNGKKVVIYENGQFTIR